MEKGGSKMFLRGESRSSRSSHEHEQRRDGCDCGCSIKTKLYVSLTLNFVCVILFVVVFLLIGDLRTRLNRYEKLIDAARPTVAEAVRSASDKARVISSNDTKLSTTRDTKNNQRNIKPNTSEESTDGNPWVTRKSEGSGISTTKSSIKINQRSSEPETQRPHPAVRVSNDGVTVSLEYGKSESNCSCRGPPGPPGPQGIQGEKGDKGKRGRRGDRARDGSIGSAGPRGPKGDRGIRGAPGKAGPLGRPGLPGRRGEKGDSGKEDTKPSAHLTGEFTSPRLSKTKGVIQNWEDRFGFAHIGGGMTHKNGHLKIPRTGLYYIYSQIYFQAMDPLIKEISLVHFIYRKSKSDGYLTIVLRSIITKCQAKEARKNLYSGYHGGVFKLNQGDELIVGVPDEVVTLVAHTGSATFFGAFMI